MTFPGMEKRWEFSVTVGTLYITSNVFIKKGNRRTNAKIPTFFPLDLTFIIPIYTIHIHTEKVSAWGEGRGHKALSETSSQEQVPFTSCVEERSSENTVSPMCQKTRFGFPLISPEGHGLGQISPSGLKCPAAKCLELSGIRPLKVLWQLEVLGGRREGTIRKNSRN